MRLRLAVEAVVIALAITGCVSIETLDQDLKSNDVEKKAAAAHKLTQIVTRGRADFSTFDFSGRLWCAEHITDNDEIIKVLECMSCRYYDSNASREENAALAGLSDDANAPIVKTLLDNLGLNQTAINIFTDNDIGFASQVYDVVVKYIKVYIETTDNIDELIKAMDKYANWQSRSSYGRYGKSSCDLQKDLYEHIIPLRIVTLITGVDDVKKFIDGYQTRGRIMPEDMKALAIAKINSQNELARLLAAYKDSRSLRNTIINRIDDNRILSKIAINEMDVSTSWGSSSEGEMALAKITDKAALLSIALLAKNNEISKRAKEKLCDNSAIVNGLVKLLNGKKISEKKACERMKALGGIAATLDLYNSVHELSSKKYIFASLSAADRKTVREKDVLKCKQMIESASAKANTTFEMGGFYLGMDVSEAEMLIGYYFPDYAIEEDFGRDGESVCGVRIPQQSSVFGRIDNDNKVWQLNFGKDFLKKFCKYDVQDETEWAHVYSKGHGINMRHVFLNEDTTIAGYDFSTYKAWLHQDTWQWRNNACGYKLIYFGERNIETAHGELIRQQASYEFRFISAEAGTLRATIDKE